MSGCKLLTVQEHLADHSAAAAAREAGKDAQPELVCVSPVLV